MCWDSPTPPAEHTPLSRHPRPVAPRVADSSPPGQRGISHNAAVTTDEKPTPPTAAARLQYVDQAGALAAIIGAVDEVGGSVRMLTTVRRHAAQPDVMEVELEAFGCSDAALEAALRGVPGVRAVEATRVLDRVFGKRIIVVGGGAQVAQVALGAVTEADRHNLRGERISVDTIPLVGEEAIAAAVRGVADLPRARCLVLAGSLMGGDIRRAVEELRAHGVPVIALNMAGSVPDAADLVVSDPVQAGTMAVMAIADTASFDLARQRGRRY